MPTTLELLQNIIEIRLSLDMVEDEQMKQNLREAEEELIHLLEKKTDNIDTFILSLKKKEATIDAEINVLKAELERLNRRKKSIIASTKRFNHFLLPLIIDEIGTNGKLETQTAKYTTFETWKVEEWLEEMLPEKYKRIEEVVKYDKISAKKDAVKAIEEGMTLAGCKLVRERNIRRS